MAITLSRVDRVARTHPAPTGATAVSVALLPPLGTRGGPTAATVWTAATLAGGSWTVTLAGPDADPTGAVVVPATADLWQRSTTPTGVDAELVERVSVLGGGPLLPAAAGTAVVSVNGKTGSAVVVTADDIGDGTAKVTMTTAERTKLTGVATGATANATDAQLRDRSTHTGTQPAATISDSTATGRAVLTAADAAAARTATGAAASAHTHAATTTPGGLAVQPYAGGILLDRIVDGLAAGDVQTAVEKLHAAGASGAPDATATAKGILQLAGDLAGTAAAPTVPGLAGKANTAHTHGVADLTATGTRDATTFLRGDNTWAAPAGGGGGTSRLAEKYHNPATGADYSNAGGLVFTKVDATNLVVTFTAPASGRVRATVFGLGKVGTNGHSLRLALIDAADAVISGSTTGPTDSIITQTNQFARFAIPYIVDGLTSGTTYTWNLGWRMSGAAETGTLKQSGTGGPIGIEIEAW